MAVSGTVPLLVERWSRVPGNIRGAIWVLLAGLGFMGMNVSLKVLGERMSVWELLFLRSVFAFLVIAPMMARHGFTHVRTRKIGGHLWRAALGFGGIFFLTLALAKLPLAMVTTLGFTRTLFMIVLAALFLGEAIRWRRSLATVVGFGGVVVCVQPGAESFDPWTVLAIAQAVFAALVSTTVKRLTVTEHPLTILFYTYGFMAMFAIAPTVVEWRTPELWEIGIVAGMGLCTAAGQYCMVCGLRAGEATVVVPFEYARLLYAAGIGFVLFGEVPGVSTIGGGAIIIGSTLYIALREAGLAKAARRKEPTA